MSELSYYLFCEIPDAKWPKWTLAVLATSLSDARRYINVYHHKGKYVGKVDGGKVQADCGAVTKDAEQITTCKGGEHMKANGITYQQCKEILYTYAKHDPEVSKREVYEMIADSTALALNEVDAADRRIIKRNASKIVEKFNHLGEQSALELLASIGNYLNDKEK